MLASHGALGPAFDQLILIPARLYPRIRGLPWPSPLNDPGDANEWPALASIYAPFIIGALAITRAAALSFVVNIILSVLLMHWFSTVGLALASNLAGVQKITVAVTVQSKSTDVAYGGQSTITMSLNADLRNHGLPS